MKRMHLFICTKVLFKIHPGLPFLLDFNLLLYIFPGVRSNNIEEYHINITNYTKSIVLYQK